MHHFSMTNCNRLANLKTTLRRWVATLETNTKVAIVKYGSRNMCITGSRTVTKDCFDTMSSGDSSADKTQLISAIKSMNADMGGNLLNQALQSAYTIIRDEHDASSASP